MELYVGYLTGHGQIAVRQFLRLFGLSGPNSRGTVLIDQDPRKNNSDKIEMGESASEVYKSGASRTSIFGTISCATTGRGNSPRCSLDERQVSRQ